MSNFEQQRFVSYLRVSTARQGKDGLGIDAQRRAVSDHLASRSSGALLLSEYVEQESGRVNDRPELIKAMRHQRLSGARLVIAKLDRLSRNAAFLVSLREAGVDFVAADNPDASKLTIHILAGVAEHERDLISERTKAALRAAKARGTKLGNPNGAAHLNTTPGRYRAALAGLRAKADARAEAFRETVMDLVAEGIVSHQTIAKALNEAGIRSPRDGTWTATSVGRLTKRLESLDRRRITSQG